ncbi:MAG: LLM class F420-dependent oxidoreductase, partial [Chloroflexota bacterium]
MKIGVSIPRWPDVPGLKRFAQRAEELGFESVLAGDHIVLPTSGTSQYPYTADGSFQRPTDEPFLETMTLLAYLAACTHTIKLGTTVIILPYRNPVVQAKMFASLDVLTNGRIICGVGVGWLEKEFDTLGVPYAQRGPMTDEFLQIFKVLWTEADPQFHGRFYHIEGIQFYPKPVQKPHIPIWVGGHTRLALRRTARYGDCWHTTRQTPDFVAQHLPYLRRQTERAGRDPASISISLKRSLHFTDIGLGEGRGVRTGGAVIGTTQEVIDDVYYCR